MTAHQTGLAARGFGSEQVRTARGMEYDAFSRVTRQLQRALARQDSPAVAAGANAQLWTVLASDLAEEDNALPAELRAGLLSLAIFSLRHGRAVMAQGASPQPLIDINLHVMKGLRGEVAA